MITSGTIKVTFPSSYADNRRGSEVSLSYALEENAEWLTAEAVIGRVSAMAVKTGLAIVAGEFDRSSTSATIAPTIAPDAPSPKRRKNPAEVVIGAPSSETVTRSGAPSSVPLATGVALPVSADASAPPPATDATNVFPMPGAVTGPQPVQPVIAPSALVPGLVMPGESASPLPAPAPPGAAASPSVAEVSAVAGGGPLASAEGLLKWAQAKIPPLNDKVGQGRGPGKLIEAIMQVAELPPEQRQRATIGYVFAQGKAAEFVAAVEALLAA